MAATPNYEWRPHENGLHHFYYTTYEIDGECAQIAEVSGRSESGFWWFMKDDSGELGHVEHLFQAKAEVEKRAIKSVQNIENRAKQFAVNQWEWAKRDKAENRANIQEKQQERDDLLNVAF